MKLGEDGVTFEENWQAELPEELQGDKTLAEIRDVPTMAKMLVNAQKMVGADKIIVPSHDAGEEEWQKVFDKLGRPENPEEYGIAKPEDFPDDVPFDEEMLTEFQQLAHEAGLLPGQAKKIAEWYLDKTKATYAQSQTALEEAKEQAEAELKDKWRQKYTENKERAMVAAKTFLGEDGINRLNETGLGNAPWLIEAFKNIGDSMAEDKIIKPEIPDNAVTAQAAINRILRDKDHPYHNKQAPGHREAVMKVQDLYKELYPE